MSGDNLPASVKITLAQERRRRRRRGVLRAKIVAAAFGIAVFIGFIGGCTTPGA